MLAIVGDIHGVVPDFKRVLKVIEEFNNSPIADKIVAVIQVGDYGWYTKTRPHFNTIISSLPIYWIDGNHEDHEALQQYGTTVTEVAPNQFYVPRGTVLELDGRKIAFMGGAASVDKQIRLQQRMHWSPLENITDEQMHRLDGVEGIDILITHTPPQSIIKKYFDPLNLLMFGLPPSWVDRNAKKIETLWGQLGYPQVISGHMHRQVIGEKYRILDINELFCI